MAEADLKGNSRPDLVLELALVRISDTRALAGVSAATFVSAHESLPGVPPEPVSGPRFGSGNAARRSTRPERIQQPPSGWQNRPRRQPDRERAASVPAAAGTGGAAQETGETDAANAGKPVLRGRRRAAVQLGEIRQLFEQAFQKQPVVAQALAACNLTREGDHLVMSAKSTFVQEMLLKEESRRKLQDTLRQCHPELELEIISEVTNQTSDVGKKQKQNAEVRVPASARKLHQVQ